jgi:hypothetical protein
MIRRKCVRRRRALRRIRRIPEIVNLECIDAWCHERKRTGKAGEEATAAEEEGSHQTNPGVEVPSDGGTSID